MQPLPNVNLKSPPPPQPTQATPFVGDKVGWGSEASIQVHIISGKARGTVASELEELEKQVRCRNRQLLGALWHPAPPHSNFVSILWKPVCGRFGILDIDRTDCKELVPRFSPVLVKGSVGKSTLHVFFCFLHHRRHYK